MCGSKSVVCMDFGSGSLKLAEFDADAAGSPRLRWYSVRAFAAEPAQDAARDSACCSKLAGLVAERGLRARCCSACLPGVSTFSKFIALPPMEESKIARIIRFEAQQHVPFPLEQAVWDYQVLSNLPAGERELVLAAAKTDSVTTLVRATESAGLRLDAVDAAPAALSNAFRYNYSDLAGCSALLDIGARTSTLLLFEGERVFWRAIGLGANAITEGVAAEARLPLAEAERVKIAEGFVGLGGAFQEPDDPRQAIIAKVARQVMTRLHLQINQTLLFYRGQHKGAAPDRLFLAGGGATMPHTAQFFAEKLGVPVDYFNPFRQLHISPSVNPVELATVAHSLGQVVGLGLRKPTRCPLELDLLPATVREQCHLRHRKPYLVAAFASLVFVISTLGWFLGRLADEKHAVVLERKPAAAYLQARAKQIELALTKRNVARKTVDELTDCMLDRFFWSDLLADLQQALERTESGIRHPGTRPNIWIEKMSAEVPETLDVSEAEVETPARTIDPRVLKRYFPEAYARLQAFGQQGLVSPVTPGLLKFEQAAPSATNTIATIHLGCRAVSWNKVHPTIDSELTYVFLRQLKASPFSMNGTNGTRLAGAIERDETTGTFSFEAVFVLKKSIHL